MAKFFITVHILIFTHSPYAYWGGMAGAAPPLSHHILMAQRVCVHRKTGLLTTFWTYYFVTKQLFCYKAFVTKKDLWTVFLKEAYSIYQQLFKCALRFVGHQCRWRLLLFTVSSFYWFALVVLSLAIYLWYYKWLSAQLV